MLGHKDANSTEMDPECKHPVISDMPGHTNIDMGGTMRLGRQTTVFSKEHMDYSVVRKWLLVFSFRNLYIYSSYAFINRRKVQF